MIDPEILYEDKQFLVINKSAGILVHPGDQSDEETVLDWLLHTYEWAKDIHNPYQLQSKEINLSGIVHRLDRDTSGILLIAKDQETLEKLKVLFKDGQVEKKYTALVHGHTKEVITIDTKLGREKKGFKRLPEGHMNARGPYVEALTKVHPISYNKETDTTLVELTPLTGRTHQLRAHLSFIDHPIVGDKLYGNDKDKKENRLYLHALSIVIPTYNLSIVTAMPKELTLRQQSEQ